MSKVLICGANGYIGSYIYKKTKKKYEVIGVSKNHLESDKTHKVDFLNIGMVNSFVKRIDKIKILIFTIGLAHKKGNNYSKYLDVNFKSLENLLKAFELYSEVPSKIIFTSTISVYGERIEKCVYNEDLCLSPTSAYALTKVKAENYLLNNYLKKSWILRLAPVYSSELTFNLEKRTKIITVPFKVGDGESFLSLCHIDNIRKVIIAIIKDEVPSGVYNISDKKAYTYNDLLKYFKFKKILTIPRVIVTFCFYFSKFLDVKSFNENSIKLISNNIFPSDKICEFVSLNKKLDT